MSFPVFDPTEGTVPHAFAMAPRLGNLAGAVIGMIDNGKTKSDQLLAALQRVLRDEAGVADFVVVRKPSAGKPAPDPMLDDLARRTRAVITGIGD